MGNDEKYFVATKNTDPSNPLNGNYISFSFNKNNWTWLSSFPDDSLSKFVNQPKPNPQGNQLIYSRYIDNAWQLFMMDEQGTNENQLTKLGGNDVSWSKDGRYVYFNRDTHKGLGARFIPHYYELETDKIEALWPNLPDSVPQFPELNTQNPIDLRSIVQDGSSGTTN